MSGESEVVLCPECQVAVVRSGVDYKCLKCGLVVDVGYWPRIVGHEHLSPCSAANLDPPENVGGHFHLPQFAESVQDGCWVNRGVFKIHPHKQVILIGSNSRDADIEIRGAHPLHAALLQHRVSKDWWVYDCGSPSGTYVQDKRIHCCKLNRGDVIVVAGVKILFRGDCLDPNVNEEAGLSLSVRGLGFSSAERQILQDVSFDVQPGEFIGILGPSGCGKSTLIQRIIGLAGGVKPEGRIFVNGNDIKECVDSYRLATSYLPQNVTETLHGALTLDEEIDLFCKIHTGESAGNEAAEILERLGLTKRRTERVGAFSGGEKRRVGIALSMLRKPKLLLMDEPGAGLDPKSEKDLMEYLKVRSSRGETVLCVTHLLKHVKSFSRILILSKRGRVVYFDAPDKVCPTFGVQNLGEVYSMLDQDCVPVMYHAESRSPVLEPIPQVGMATFRNAVVGYLVRYFKEFVKDGWTPFKFFLGYPLVLIFGIRLACACYFRANGGKPVSGIDTLAFCSSLAMFWLGINNAARSLVRERIPGRCLERLNQVPLVTYLISKLLWSVSLCACQALSFTMLLCIAGVIPVPLETAIESPCLAISVLWYVPLFVSCLTGALWGLAVSAISREQMTAISWVPNLAILALLFSQTLIRFEHETFYSPIAKTIATVFMPCYWPSVIMENLQSGVSGFAAIIWMMGQFLVYGLIAVVLIYFFQNRNENAWDGR